MDRESIAESQEKLQTTALVQTMSNDSTGTQVNDIYPFNNQVPQTQGRIIKCGSSVDSSLEMVEGQ